MKVVLSLAITSGFAVARRGCYGGYDGHGCYYSSFKIVAKKNKMPQPSSPKVGTIVIYFSLYLTHLMIISIKGVKTLPPLMCTHTHIYAQGLLSSGKILDTQ